MSLLLLLFYGSFAQSIHKEVLVDETDFFLRFRLGHYQDDVCIVLGIAELRSLCDALIKDNQRLREAHDTQD